MSPLHAPGKDRAGGVRELIPGSETLGREPGRLEEGEAWGWGQWPSPAVALLVQHRGDRALAQRRCAGGETESSLIRDSPEVGRGLRSGQDQGRRAPGETVCSCGVVSKGSLRNWRRSWGTQHAVKGGSTFPVYQTGAKALWQGLHCLCVVRAEPRVGDGARSVDGGGRVVSVWRFVGPCKPGKSLAFVLCYGMRSVGSLGAVFHCQRSTLVFFVCQPPAGDVWWARDPFRGSCRCPGDVM